MGSSKSKRVKENNVCTHSINHHIIITNECDDFTSHGLNGACYSGAGYDGLSGNFAGPEVHYSGYVAQAGCYGPESHNGYIAQPVAYGPEPLYNKYAPIAQGSAPFYNRYESQAVAQGSAPFYNGYASQALASAPLHNEFTNQAAPSLAISYGSTSLFSGYSSQAPSQAISTDSSKAFYNSVKYNQPAYQHRGVGAQKNASVGINAGVSVATYPSYVNSQMKPNYIRVMPNSPKYEIYSENNSTKSSRSKTQSSQIKPPRSIIKKSKSKSPVLIDSRNLTHAC